MTPWFRSHQRLRAHQHITMITAARPSVGHHHQCLKIEWSMLECIPSNSQHPNNSIVVCVFIVCLKDFFKVYCRSHQRDNGLTHTMHSDNRDIQPLRCFENSHSWSAWFDVCTGTSILVLVLVLVVVLSKSQLWRTLRLTTGKNEKEYSSHLEYPCHL